MAENGHRPPGLAALSSRMVRTGVGLLRNRAELLSLEWEEERARLLELFLWAVGFLFFVVMAFALITASIIFAVPEHARIYVAVGFAVLYLGGAVAVWLTLKSMLKQEPFQESIRQVKMDKAWVESLK